MKTTIQKLGLLIAMLFAILPASAYDFEDNGVYYNLLSATDLTCEITYGDVKYSGDFTIPSKVMYKGRELTVTRIGSSAFRNCKELTNVNIPECIDMIYSRAFEGCESFTHFRIPENVWYIGGYIFSGCINLQSVEFPISIRQISNGTFNGCTSLTQFSVPENADSIGSSAFQDCENLQSIIIPSSVKGIGKKAFSGCSNLKEISLPENITYIKYNTFHNCRLLSSITIPSKVKSITYGAFDSCNGLETVIFDSSKTPISTNRDSDGYNDDGFFMNCPNLRNLAVGRIIPVSALGIDRVTKLTLMKNSSMDQFKDLRTIEEIVFAADISSTEINYKEFYNFKKLQCIVCESEIPNPDLCPSVDNIQLSNLIIYVPDGCVSAYQNADGWKNFWDIREISSREESSGITVINSSYVRNEIARYNMQGNQVDEHYKGFVIICYSDGSSKKVLQK